MRSTTERWPFKTTVEKTRGGKIRSDRYRNPNATTSSIQERIDELFADARQMHSQAVERLKQGDSATP